MHRRFTPPPKSIATALGLVAAFVVGMIAYHFTFTGANADSRASEGVATVRIAAMRDGEGDVRVALQQQAASGDWGERQLPARRVLRASAPADEWRTSSPLQVRTADSATAAGPLFCVVAHGEPTDPFWRQVRASARLATEHQGLNVRFSTSLDSSAQAAAIERCSADGAAVIASTLAAPDALGDALRAAKAAGSKIVTFNSGAEYADSVGSSLHIALDEAAAGRLAGEQFNEAGLNGTLACIIHEAENVGLEQRCDALAEAYTGGDVLRMQLDEGLDQPGAVRAIAARLLDDQEPPLAGLLALNARTLRIALTAVIQTADRLERTVQVGSVGLPGGALRGVDPQHLARHYSVAMDAFAEQQGYLIVSAMQLVHARTGPSEFFGAAPILTASAAAGRRTPTGGQRGSDGGGRSTAGGVPGLGRRVGRGLSQSDRAGSAPRSRAFAEVGRASGAAEPIRKARRDGCDHERGSGARIAGSRPRTVRRCGPAPRPGGGIPAGRAQ